MCLPVWFITMPIFTADKIHNGERWLQQGSTVETSADGTIIALHSAPHPEAIYYEGILIPGFVNTHCHLELSHMKGTVPEHTGLIPFLKRIPQQRNNYTEQQKMSARFAAYQQLSDNGVVAVGDIANTTDTLDLRAMGNLHFYTFVESIGFTEGNAPRSFDYAVQTCNAFAAQQSTTSILKQAIVPHAPYSVSSSLFRLIDHHRKDVIISIHNQESEEENKFYTSKEGNVRDLLSALGIDDSPFTPSGKSSLQTYLDWLSADHPFLLVHNTYTRRDDVQYAHSRLKEVHWCLCPNANIYIENRLPDLDMLISEGANLCIGTDSLASNHQLNILAELHTIKKHYPQTEWETLLTWATKNGARAMQMDEQIGTIAPGKKPGLVQITDLEHTGSYKINRVI
jgi:cytosine/adenosine deaminase-related metal-dependent hydrolase